MFRSGDAAARARIADLERQLMELKEHASDQAEEAGEQIQELEAELERLRRAKVSKSRTRWIIVLGVLLAFGEVGAIVAATAVGSTDPPPDLETGCRDGDGQACVDLGVQLRDSDPKRAEPLFRRACELGSQRGCSELGWMALDRGDVATAEPLLQKACEANEARACVNLGVIMDKRGDAKAQEFARKACDLGDVLGCSNLAGLFDDKGDLAKAIEFARKSCNGGSPFGCADLSWYLLRDKKAKEALQHATRASEINPALPKVQMKLGHAVLIDGDVEEAVRRYRRAIELEDTPRGNERTFADKPWAATTRENLELLKTIYPERAEDIDTVLSRRKEWNP